jgi:hypothetical protein
MMMLPWWIVGREEEEEEEEEGNCALTQRYTVTKAADADSVLEVKSRLSVVALFTCQVGEKKKE